MYLGTYSDAHLVARFKLARAKVSGSLRHSDYEEGMQTLGISKRTFNRDVARARVYATLEDWRPRKRGPPEGIRRAPKSISELIETLVYSKSTEKLNVSLLARNARSAMISQRLPPADIPALRTIVRHIEDVIRSDPAHFAGARHGRAGQFKYTLKRGELSAERPLQVVCIDHTPIDCLSRLPSGESVRGWATAAVDVATDMCLAAFVSLNAPNAESVALCMALISTSKTEILRTYDVPGTWDEAGIPLSLHVDGGVELSSNAVKDACRRYAIDLVVGPPGEPQRRGKMERLWRTFTSEVHSWPGTTLSNTVELERHGRQQKPLMTFDELQRRFLIAVLEYNNENYGAPQLPPTVQWRQLCGGYTPELNGRTPSDVFIDFLPSIDATIAYEGVKLKRCEYRSAELAGLRYAGVKKVKLIYDPRNISSVWVEAKTGERHRVKRVHPVNAPVDIHVLKRWNSAQSDLARAARDEELLAQLERAKRIRSNPAPIALPSMETEASPLRELGVEGSNPARLLEPSKGEAAKFEIPQYKARIC